MFDYGHVTGAVMPPSGDPECQTTPEFGVCTGRMPEKALGADHRRIRRRRSVHERSHYAACTPITERDVHLHSLRG